MASRPTPRRGMSRERWMAAGFALGSLCFLVGPFPGFGSVVGATAVALTFFVGSLLFTTGGALQTWIAAGERHAGAIGRAAWWSAVIQSAGTLFFNFSTFRAVQVVVADPDYDRLVWRPDAFGSVCFLVSGVIAYRASSRRGWLPARQAPGWWEPAVNLLGCALFGVSAVAGYVVASSTTVIDQAAANWNTSLGAACFLTCAVGTLWTGHTEKSPRLRRLRYLRRELERYSGATPGIQPRRSSGA
jgi:hypothetical protein